DELPAHLHQLPTVLGRADIMAQVRQVLLEVLARIAFVVGNDNPQAAVHRPLPSQDAATPAPAEDPGVMRQSLRGEQPARLEAEEAPSGRQTEKGTHRGIPRKVVYATPQPRAALT